MCITPVIFLNFNPRSPHGERHFTLDEKEVFFTNFNPRSPHGERQNVHALGVLLAHISIHAPRTGSDASAQASMTVSTHFNPRSPHGERRTLFGWRKSWKNFNPRSPHGERQFVLGGVAETIQISIHAPRTGSDAEVVTA